MDSKEKLAAALEEVGDDGLASMIEQARAGHYSDYESPEVSPIMMLVKDLRARKLHGLAKRAMNGEFDGTEEEAAAWAASPEGQATFRELLGS